MVMPKSFNTLIRPRPYWVWKTHCIQDPETYYVSQKYPKIDGDGYWHGKFMPPCMTTPRLVQAMNRGEAIKKLKAIYAEQPIVVIN